MAKFMGQNQNRKNQNKNQNRRNHDKSISDLEKLSLFLFPHLFNFTDILVGYFLKLFFIAKFFIFRHLFRFKLFLYFMHLISSNLADYYLTVFKFRREKLNIFFPFFC